MSVPKPVAPLLAPLLAEVEDMRRAVLDATTRVSAGQGVWKPAPDEWSIAECLEHLFLAEQGGVNGMWKAIEGVRAGRPIWSGELVHRGVPVDEIVRRTIGPSPKAPPHVQPRLGGPLGYWTAAFAGCRGVLERLAAELEGMDLETVVYPHPAAGPIDAGQRLSFLRFHMDVHRRQIEDVKRAPGYPAS